MSDQLRQVLEYTTSHDKAQHHGVTSLGSFAPPRLVAAVSSTPSCGRRTIRRARKKRRHAQIHTRLLRKASARAREIVGASRPPPQIWRPRSREIPGSFRFSTWRRLDCTLAGGFRSGRIKPDSKRFRLDPRMLDRWYCSLKTRGQVPRANFFRCEVQ